MSPSIHCAKPPDQAMLHQLLPQSQLFELLVIGELLVCQSLTSNRTQHQNEAARVVRAAIIESECFFVQISEEVSVLAIDVCTPQSTLEQRPVIFDPVRVNYTPHVFGSVFNHVMVEAFLQTLITLEFVRVDCRAYFDILSDFALQSLLAGSFDNLRANLPVSLQQTHDDGFIDRAASVLLAFDFMEAPGDQFIELLNGVHFIQPGNSLVVRNSENLGLGVSRR